MSNFRRASRAVSLLIFPVAMVSSMSCGGKSSPSTVYLDNASDHPIYIQLNDGHDYPASPAVPPHSGTSFGSEWQAHGDGVTISYFDGTSGMKLQVVTLTPQEVSHNWSPARIFVVTFPPLANAK
jgi:hypothetical protein